MINKSNLQYEHMSLWKDMLTIYLSIYLSISQLLDMYIPDSCFNKKDKFLLNKSSRIL